MIEYDCYTESQRRLTEGQPDKLAFTYNFLREPTPGDTVDISDIPSQPDIWRVIRRHWYDDGNCVLIVARVGSQTRTT